MNDKLPALNARVVSAKELADLRALQNDFHAIMTIAKDVTLSPLEAQYFILTYVFNKLQRLGLLLPVDYQILSMAGEDALQVLGVKTLQVVLVFDNDADLAEHIRALIREYRSANKPTSPPVVAG